MYFLFEIARKARMSSLLYIVAGVSPAYPIPSQSSIKTAGNLEFQAGKKKKEEEKEEEEEDYYDDEDDFDEDWDDDWDEDDFEEDEEEWEEKSWEEEIIKSKEKKGKIC
jgi:hypothetical protein